MKRKKNDFPCCGGNDETPQQHTQDCTVNTTQVLHRLKKRFKSERARQRKGYREGEKSGNSYHRDRCYYEANVWQAAISYVEKELKALEGR